MKLGYTTIEKLKAVEKPGKLHKEMMGYRKKHKLEVYSFSIEDDYQDGSQAESLINLTSRFSRG